MANLVAAYLLIVILVSGYTLSLWRRERLLQKEIETLEGARGSEEG